MPILLKSTQYNKTTCYSGQITGFPLKVRTLELPLDFSHMTKKC